MNKTRPNKITVRLSDLELKELQERVKKSGYNKQQYLIKSIFGKKVIEKQTYFSLLIELKRQGVNLNQIARACNSGNAVFERERLNFTIKELEKLWQFLKQ